MITIKISPLFLAKSLIFTSRMVDFKVCSDTLTGHATEQANPAASKWFSKELKAQQCFNFI